MSTCWSSLVESARLRTSSGGGKKRVGQPSSEVNIHQIILFRCNFLSSFLLFFWSFLNSWCLCIYKGLWSTEIRSQTWSKASSNSTPDPRIATCRHSEEVSSCRPLHHKVFKTQPTHRTAAVAVHMLSKRLLFVYNVVVCGVLLPLMWLIVMVWSEQVIRTGRLLWVGGLPLLL